MYAMSNALFVNYNWSRGNTDEEQLHSCRNRPRGRSEGRFDYKLPGCEVVVSHLGLEAPESDDALPLLAWCSSMLGTRAQSTYLSPSDAAAWIQCIAGSLRATYQQLPRSDESLIVACQKRHAWLPWVTKLSRPEFRNLPKLCSLDFFAASWQ